MSMMQLDTMEGSFNVEAPGTATLYGVVYWPLSPAQGICGALNEYVSGVKIEIAGVGSATSDSNGQYYLGSIPAGGHTLLISGREGPGTNILSKEIPITLSEGQSLQLDIPVYGDESAFFSHNLWHTPRSLSFVPTKIEGKLRLTSLNAEKSGLAGVENDSEIRYEDQSMGLLVELTNWHYGYTGMEYGVGFIIYKKGELIHAKREPVPFGVEVSYLLSTDGGAVSVRMTDPSGKVLLEDSYPCTAQYIWPSTFFEYHWQPEEGAYYLTAEHILERMYNPAGGWKTAYECLRELPETDTWSLNGKTIHMVFRQVGSYYKIVGEIIDEGMI